MFLRVRWFTEYFQVTWNVGVAIVSELVGVLVSEIYNCFVLLLQSYRTRKRVVEVKIVVNQLLTPNSMEIRVFRLCEVKTLIYY